MISSVGSEASIFCDQRAGKGIEILLLRGSQRLRYWIDLGHDRLPLLERIVLAQRMADEGIVEQDAAQIGMPPELNAEHVEAFALQPVGGLPNRTSARHPRVIASANLDLHAQAQTTAHRFQLIDDIET